MSDPMPEDPLVPTPPQPDAHASEPEPEPPAVPRPPSEPKKGAEFRPMPPAGIPSRPASRLTAPLALSAYLSACESIGVIKLDRLREILSQPMEGTIDLSSDYIGDAGTVALSAALPHVEGLRVLRIPQNGVRNDGLAALCAALEGSEIEELHLANNRISRTGARRLIEFTRAAPALRVVDVALNPIDPHERLLLARALER